MSSLPFAATLLVGLVAFIHIFIAWMEMFAWEVRGPRVFPFPAELFPQTGAMAANQGLYNLFLAAGLIWSLLISNPQWATNIALFFCGCVAIAGLYGAMTVTPKTLLVQTLPATLAIIALLF
ncbi:DUF1304 domain-containing protein [Rhizobiaceae bacterium]|nr:DUF1304 domain-containing protein [Rhizobiaceae bacterium]